jgi:hypothetical protein
LGFCHLGLDTLFVALGGGGEGAVLVFAKLAFQFAFALDGFEAV